MRIADALNGVTRLGLDSAPVIYYIEKHPAFHALCVPFFAALDSGQIDCYTATLTLTETLPHPLRNNDAALIQQYRDFLLATDGLTAVELLASIAERAADLRARYNLRTPDAIQLATAIDAGCDAILTNDDALKRVTEITVLVLKNLTP